MRTYRRNAFIVGLLYFMGTAFGVLGTITGGEVVSSIVQTKPLTDVILLDLVVASSDRILYSSFLILFMGISLTGMTVFLYPIIKKDSEELALGMLLFRGALEGVYYLLTTLSLLALIALGEEYTRTGSGSPALRSLSDVIYRIQDFLGPIGTILFLIGAACLYLSFYRTQLIPRWLTIWGLVGVVPYLGYALLHLFGLDSGYGVYLQMILAPQEVIMGLWLMIKGFNKEVLVC